MTEPAISSEIRHTVLNRAAKPTDETMYFYRPMWLKNH